MNEDTKEDDTGESYKTLEGKMEGEVQDEDGGQYVPINGRARCQPTMFPERFLPRLLLLAVLCISQGGGSESHAWAFDMTGCIGNHFV